MDEELLKLAAKAINIELFEDDFHDGELCYYDNEIDCNITWNPIINDGDALRLASLLSMDIFINQITVVIEYNKIDVTEECTGKYDRHIALRMAITKCAAEIGRNMK